MRCPHTGVPFPQDQSRSMLSGWLPLLLLALLVAIWVLAGGIYLTRRHGKCCNSVEKSLRRQQQIRSFSFFPMMATQRVMVHLIRVLYTTRHVLFFSSDFSVHVTTQKQLALVACGRQSAAILSDKSTVPVLYPNKPTLLLLSMQSAGDPCPWAL